MYELLGVAGLKLGWVGRLSRGATATGCHHLAPDQNYWNLAELQGYVQQEYDVVFDSKQSYYSLFEEAGISWKTQKRNPKKDPELVKKKTRDYRLVRSPSPRLSLGSWWSSSMNATCYGAISAAR